MSVDASAVLERVSVRVLERDVAPGGDVLGNMSSRPRTEIRRVVPAVQRGWVLFALNRDRSASEFVPPELTPALLARLDERWRALGLTGATVVERTRYGAAGIDPVTCIDDELTLNVLLRVREGLLIHAMPLITSTDELGHATVVCADERLRDAVVIANRVVRRARQRARRAADATAATPTRTTTTRSTS
jgi:hypothetical protein